MKPKIQLALDLTDLDEAIRIAQEASSEVDIIEVGTVLAIESGLESVRKIREKLPNAKILADIRIIKAGGKLSKMAFEAGADIVTIISDATEETFEAVINEKNKFTDKDVLIEINDTYTDEMLNYWKKSGLTHIIYHRGSEITATNDEWNEKDFNEIKRLYEEGFKVYVTGGIGLEEIKLFKRTPVECFIIGRTIAKSENVKEKAKEFKDVISNTDWEL